MTATRVRLVDLDDTIDVGNGGSLKQLLLDIRAIATDGTTSTIFKLGSTNTDSDIELRFGNSNTPDTPPILKFDLSESRLAFSADPDNVTYDTLVVSSDLVTFGNHIADESAATVHGGLVKSVGTLFADGNTNVSAKNGAINFKDNDFVSWTLDPTNKFMTSEVKRSRTLTLNSWTSETSNALAPLSGEWKQISTTIEDEVSGGAGTTKDVIIYLPDGFETLSTVATHVTLVSDDTYSTLVTAAIRYTGTSPYSTTEISVRVTNLDLYPQQFRVLVSTWVREIPE